MESSPSTSSLPPPPITLIPPGSREVVDEKCADEIIEYWKNQINAQREAMIQYQAALLKNKKTHHGNEDDDEATTHRTSSTNSTAKTGRATTKLDKDVTLVDKIVLSDKSYTAGAAVKIASFLTETNGDFWPASFSIASRIVSADLSDIIASRMEEEGLQVLQILCDAFHDSSLQEVNLSENAMGSKGIKACSTVLIGQSASLERLLLCNNGLSEESMNDVADMLTGGMEGNDDDANDSGCICERLTKIHFFNNMSGDEGCRAFARILSRCTSALRDVRFSGTRAGKEGSLMIASALDGLGEERIKNLERLDLADNTFGCEGAVNLSRALRRCGNLKYLNLRDCVLEDEGTGMVCRALWSADAPLVHLDLSGNEITKKGAKSIAELLEENATLRVLHAEENEMTSLGVKYIASALYTASEEEEYNAHVNESIEEIRLGHNECGKVGAAALIDAYGPGGEGMPNLRLIALDGNMFPAEDVEALEKSFGDKLEEMEDNDDEADVDDEIDEEEEEEEDEREEDVGHKEETDVNKLAKSIAEGLTIDGLC